MTPLLALAACAPPHALVPVEAEANPHNPFAALVTGSWDRDVEVWVEYGDDRSTPAQQVPAGEVTELLVLGLHAGQRHGLEVVSTDGEHTWTQSTSLRTEGLPEDWPTCASHRAPPQPLSEEVVCTNGTRGTPVYQCIDQAGDPVWSLSHPDGSPMRAVRALSDGGWAAVNLEQSSVSVFDPRGAMLEDLTALDLADQTRFVHEFIDMHEVIELTAGPWQGALAVITVTSDEVEEGTWLLGGGIVVVDWHSGEVLWDWSAHGALGDGVPIDPALDYDRVPSGDGDWLHLNALVHEVGGDGSQRFWVSSRHQSWIFAVDVATDVITWRLGAEGDFDLVDDLDQGEPLEPAGWMHWQHSPELVSRDGDRTRLLVFDNGLRAPPEGEERVSRVLGLEVDEGSRSAAPTLELEVDYASQAGDTDLLDGGDRVLVLGHGPDLAIHGYPGLEEQWRWTCTDTGGMYRAQGYPSLYQTTWRTGM